MFHNICNALVTVVGLKLVCIPRYLSPGGLYALRIKGLKNIIFSSITDVTSARRYHWSFYSVNLLSIQIWIKTIYRRSPYV